MRLIVNIDDLRAFDRDYANGLLKNPLEYHSAAEDALGSIIEHVFSEKSVVDPAGFRIGFSGSFGDHHVSPRTLNASQLGKMISLEGIITRCSLVRPKMVKSAHYCPTTSHFYTRPYHDALTSTSTELPTTSIVPQTDDDNNLLQIEYGFCEFRDYQRISIQEMPERAPAGQLPRSTDVVLDGDLVDKCKPGDRIQLVGMYRSIGGGSSGAFKSVLPHTFLPIFLIVFLDPSSSQTTSTSFHRRSAAALLKRLSQKLTSE